MVSDFLREKLNFVFDTFFDVTKDGSIQQDDFELAIEKVAASRGFKNGSDEYIELTHRFLHFWVKLQAAADSDGDNQISREEWADLWTNSMVDEWKILFMDFMFQLQDTSGDGSIDLEEFVQVFTTFGIPSAECQEAYKILTKNGRHKIDFSYFSALWKDYFTSDEPKQIGNCIFGKIFSK